MAEIVLNIVRGATFEAFVLALEALWLDVLSALTGGVL